MPNIPDRGSSKKIPEVRTASVSSAAQSATPVDGAHYSKNPFMEKLSVNKFNYPTKALVKALFNQDSR